MKALKALCIIVIVLVIIIAVIGLFLPSEYKVSRSVHIETNPTHVSAYIVNLNQWPHWSPWEEGDPSLVVKLGDKTSGVGATQSWQGDSSNGRLEVTELTDTSIRYMCYFDDDSNSADCLMSYVKAGDGTDVSWEMKGNIDVPVVGGYLALMLEGMVGRMFNTGLKKLKYAAEGKADEFNGDAAKPEENADQDASSANDLKDTDTSTEATGSLRTPIKGQATKRD